MDKNGLETRTAIVAVAATAIVLCGGFAIPTVYANTTHFTTDFETSLIPACTTEEVVYSGTQHFDFQEQNGRQTVHVYYSDVHGVGIVTGTRYTVHENDEYTTILNENGDTKFDTTIHGSFISSGQGDNTKVVIRIVTIVHANGEVETLVEDAKVTCPG